MLEQQDKDLTMNDAGDQAVLAPGLDLARYDADAIAQCAAEVRAADSPSSLFFQYVLHAGRPRDKHTATVVKILQAALQLGHGAWPLELRTLVQNRDVLHLGCGQTLYGPVFRALGANSYTGLDRGIEPASKKFRSRVEKKSVDAGLALTDVMRCMPGLTYLRGLDVIFQDAFDVVLINGATHTHPDLEGVFGALARALRPGGELWFVHDNFNAWAGHQGLPRSPSAIDLADPEQAALADWGHLRWQAPEGHRLHGFNRVTPGQLRRLVDPHFEVRDWKLVQDRSAIAARLTPEVRATLPAGLDDQDLLVKQVLCRAVRRR